MSLPSMYVTSNDTGDHRNGKVLSAVRNLCSQTGVLYPVWLTPLLAVRLVRRGDRRGAVQGQWNGLVTERIHIAGDVEISRLEP